MWRHLLQLFGRCAEKWRQGASVAGWYLAVSCVSTASAGGSLPLAPTFLLNSPGLLALPPSHDPYRIAALMKES